ncbi:MAG: hypothetical protein IIC67_06205 [Thaumarchaeota archaeon]|nr:hypothetical protein [Nitrososphaerota archaeon]
MKTRKVIDSLNKTQESLDQSIPFLEEKIKEFSSISALADTKEKQEIGHTYNDLANMLGVITEHAQILSALVAFEKSDYEAILDLFELVKEIDESALKKDEFKEKLKKLEERKRSLLSKFPLKLDQFKLNFGVASATFKPKDKK